MVEHLVLFALKDDITDAQGEDKLQKEAARRKMDPWEIAKEEEQNFKDNSESFN